MLSSAERELALRFLPHFCKDKQEPFPIAQIGCTVVTEPMYSESFRNLKLDPGAEGADFIIEYAIYFDYDIQHLYDLEHAWVAVKDGAVTKCWCSFHGMRLCASGVGDLYRLEDGLPLLYIQPGKHAILPDPRLFGLHTQANTCCGALCGGGLLIPEMLKDKMQTDPRQDERIRTFIRRSFAFTPSWEFIPEIVAPSAVTSWAQLKQAIPGYVDNQLARIMDGT